MKLTKRQLVRLIKEQTSLKTKDEIINCIIKKFESVIEDINIQNLSSDISNNCLDEDEDDLGNNRQIEKDLIYSLGKVQDKLKKFVDSIVKSTKLF